VEAITVKRGKPVAPSAIDGMVSQADHINYQALRAPKDHADGTNGVPRFLAVVSSMSSRSASPTLCALVSGCDPAEVE
jgi:hypothetical protein